MQSHQPYSMSARTSGSKSFSSCFKNWRATLLATALCTSPACAFDPVNEYKSSEEDASTYFSSFSGGGGSSHSRSHGSSVHTRDTSFSGITIPDPIDAQTVMGEHAGPYKTFEAILSHLPSYFFRHNIPNTFGDGVLWFSFTKDGKNTVHRFEKISKATRSYIRNIETVGFFLNSEIAEDPAALAHFALAGRQSVQENSNVQRIVSVEKAPQNLLKQMTERPDLWSWVTGVDLSYSQLGDRLEDEPAAQLARLGSFAHISTIDLSHNNISAVQLNNLLRNLAGRTSTFELDLSHNPLGSEAGPMLANFLAANTACTSLNLRNTGLTDATIEEIDRSLTRERRTKERTVELAPLRLFLSANPVSEKIFQRLKNAVEMEGFGANLRIPDIAATSTFAAYQNDNQLLKNWQSQLKIENGKLTFRALGTPLTTMALKEITEALLHEATLTELTFDDAPLAEATPGGSSIDELLSGSRLLPLVPLFTKGNLTALTLRKMGLKPTDLGALSTALAINRSWAERLLHLDMGNNQIGQAVLRNLTPLLSLASGLQTLRLDNNDLRDALRHIFADLAIHVCLKELDIRNNSTTDNEHAELLYWLCKDRLQSLRMVRKGNNDVWHLPARHTFIGLERNITLDGYLLNMPGFNWSTHGTYVLAHLKGIESLTIKNLDSDFLPAILSLLENGCAETLQTFEFKTNYWTNQQLLELLTKLPQSITGIVIEALYSFNQAETQNFIKILGNLKNLQRLAIKYFKLNSDTSFEPILALPKLLSLSLHNNGLQSSWTLTKSLILPRGTSLKKFSISLNQLGPHTRVLINSLPETLEKLSLLHPGADEASLDVLHMYIRLNRSLKRLSLYDDLLTDERLMNIKKDMPPKCHFTQVWDTNDLSRDWAKFLAVAPKIQKGELEIGPTTMRVTVLDLSSRNIGTEEAKVIAETLPSCPSLKYLYLCSDQISDEGAKAIAEALPSCPSLLEIQLLYNQIGNEGAKAIAKALPSCPSLNGIYLHGNRIDDEGTEAIAESLLSCPLLQHLDLIENKISDEGAKAIAKALPSCPSLRNLYLGKNKISDEGAKAIAEAAQSHPSLHVLYLLDNPISAKGKAALDAVKATRPGVDWHY